MFQIIGYKKLIWFALICVIAGIIFAVFYDGIVSEAKSMRRIGGIYKLIDEYLGRLGISLLLIGGGVIIGLRAWVGIRQENQG